MQNEKYSVFISFKRNALDGSGKTRDCELAEHLHKTLQANGIVTFFSEKDLFTSRFRRQIDDALDQAQILVVVGTSCENMEAEWVKYEWETFQNDIWEKLKPNGEIITYLEGMSPREAPRGLRTLQSFQSNELKELVKFIKKILGMDTDAEIIIPPYQSELEEEERQRKIKLKLEEEQRQREAQLKLEDEEHQRQAKLKLQEEQRRHEAQLKLEEEERQRKAQLKLQEEERQRKAQRLQDEKLRLEEKQRQREERLKRLRPVLSIAAVIALFTIALMAISNFNGGNEDAISYDDKASSDVLSFYEYKYTIENEEVTITGFNNRKEELTIPSNIEGKPVTKIGDSAFIFCSLKSATIPDSVTYIGASAFNQCPSLTSITIPDSITEIGDGAFSYCSSLTSITIPDSVTEIDNSVFSGCSSLTSITIPDSVTYIGESAFYNCSSLTSITIPDNVTEIDAWAFAYCDALASITIPDNVTEIDAWAFAYCDALASITIPDSVTEIGMYAFYYCPNLTIYGKAGSFAETYANTHNIPFTAQ